MGENFDDSRIVCVWTRTVNTVWSIFGQSINRNTLWALYLLFAHTNKKLYCVMGLQSGPIVIF